MRLLIVALAALASLLLPREAAAEERILRFDSNIAVGRDGTLDVTETIHVRVENVRINHGIYRDFPTKYRATGGRRVKVDFDLTDTWLDGQVEPNKLETLTNGVRIKIGSADRTVSPGEHIYTIRYRASRMIGRFDGYDELYWNATGNGWDFPIDRASATVTLPSPARFGQRAAYTGSQGSTDSAARVTEEEPGKIRFDTTRPLYSHEGLTVAVAFPKDVVTAPTETDRMGWFLSDWGPPLVGTLGLAAVLGYLFYAWRKAGRDPRAGTIVPLFSPPDELTPAAMRYIVNQHFDNCAFAAALVDAAVKGHVRLVEEEGGWFSGNQRRIERYDMPGATPLAAPEQASLNLLVGPNDSLVMEQKNHATFSSAIKALGDRYAEAYDGKLFLRNYGWIGAAFVIFIAALWLAAASVVLAEGAGNQLLVLLSASGMAIGALIFHAAPKDKSSGRCLLHLLALAFGGAGVALGVPLIPQALTTGNWLPLAIPLIGLPFVFSSTFWMSAPTKEGRGVLDRIAGFKQYLSITERDRLDRMQAPEDTLQLFERYLPYAIALDVENRWADRYTGLLAAAAAAPGASQGFAWYSGSSNPWNDTGGFVDNIGSSLVSSVSSASTAPGSSSGSGGGGSSGGGGGGGGGGGW
ncbi:DUF2207 domain-containing protein [Sphingomonas sp. NSE70-1]|uniref:DUF2207 domain-containing protein n=1 Tax=Sphingomonas caseinilyticus TaxID=2908205 RepID=A0ABT0RR42_9SPHN|nr:DUF2207 domain-containing protein [Sphingomonas caseinilyticus]MCL6697480.1 DUF2207 domain-containing protein [Sphingomonas caseinilyticus]